MREVLGLIRTAISLTLAVVIFVVSLSVLLDEARAVGNASGVVPDFSTADGSGASDEALAGRRVPEWGRR